MVKLCFLLIAGIIQGLTEFFPVSSSAHLAFLEKVFYVPEKWRITYAVFLHSGTLLALVFFFMPKIRKKIKERDYPLLQKIILASFPLLLAIPFRNLVANTFSQMEMIGVLLLLTGILLFATRFGRRTKEEVSYSIAFLCGLFQLLAVLPGISRSGATISILLLLGIKEEPAYYFSFLLAIPAVGLANIYEIGQTLTSPEFTFSPLIILGILISFLSGLFALFFLKRVIEKKKFYLFSFYLFLFGIFLLLIKL
ncbi:MAG: undecaprenyl-diphosphate phosphatase [candidate division WOR-3 bacterium]